MSKTIEEHFKNMQKEMEPLGLPSELLTMIEASFLRGAAAGMDATVKDGPTLTAMSLLKLQLQIDPQSAVVITHH